MSNRAPDTHAHTRIVRVSANVHAISKHTHTWHTVIAGTHARTSCVCAQELKAFNKKTKEELEQAREQNRAPVIAPFTPSDQAKQLPFLRAVHLFFWVARKHELMVGLAPPRGSAPTEWDSRVMAMRLRFFNAVVSLLCGQDAAAQRPVRVQQLPIVKDGKVHFEQQQVAPAAGGGGAAAGAMPSAAAQQRKPNRCRQCGCAKCNPHNRSCSVEQRLAWCTTNGWMRHWQPDDGMMQDGPRPAKSKLKRCVRCALEQVPCWLY